VNLQSFDLLPPLVGGALIGASVSLVLWAHGRVAGISGIFGGLLRPNPSEASFRGWFLAGLLLAGLIVRVIWPQAFASTQSTGLATVVAAGLLVGFGTQLGNGCTSGHGVCGISRLSPRSLVATITFIATGALTVLLVRGAAS
jgi:uncharacterized membrane protein YedE/YeeE